MKTIVFTVDDIKAIARHVGLDQLMKEVINALTEVCREYDPRAYAIPARDGFEYRNPQLGLLEWMPALEYGVRATVKVVGYHPNNPLRKRLPTVLSTAMTFDVSSGHLTAVMDGTFVTAIRTGAASAVASRILASPESRGVGLVGCGAQALTQLHALSLVFDIDRVFVYDVNPDASRSFASRVGAFGMDPRAIESATLTRLKANADIICTATSVDLGQGPVFDDNGLRPAVHVNAVGSDFPGKTELPLALLRRSLVCPDFRPQAIREGECQQLQDHEIGPDLVDLVKHADRYAQERSRPTVFDSTGWALEDHVVIDIVTRHGMALGRGAWLEIECSPEDPANPYELMLAEQRVAAGN